MKFSNKFTNKLVSYADRYFTYDTRKLKREGDDSLSFDFIARNYDTKTSIFIGRTKHGIYVAIRRNNDYIKKGIIKTYTEVDNFKKMVRCLG